MRASRSRASTSSLADLCSETWLGSQEASPHLDVYVSPHSGIETGVALRSFSPILSPSESSREPAWSPEVTVGPIHCRILAACRVKLSKFERCSERSWAGSVASQSSFAQGVSNEKGYRRPEHQLNCQSDRSLTREAFVLRLCRCEELRVSEGRRRTEYRRGRCGHGTLLSCCVNFSRCVWTDWHGGEGARRES